MQEYLVKYTSFPDWDNIPAIRLVHTGWLTPCAVTAKAQLCHNRHSLFLRMEAEENHIRATFTGLLDPVCNDSCMEFFFAPLEDDERYFNFEYNPLGTLNLGFGMGRDTRVRQVVKNPSIFHMEPFTTQKGWGITLAIPLDFIRLYFPTFTFSGKACGNFYKCGDETNLPHYLAWAPLTCDTPDYHRREDFGSLVFEE